MFIVRSVITQGRLNTHALRVCVIAVLLEPALKIDMRWGGQWLLAQEEF